MSDMPLWTVIRYEIAEFEEPPAFHIRTPWGWAMLRDNAPGWTPPDGYRILRNGDPA